MSNTQMWLDGIYKQVFNGKVIAIVTVKGEDATMDVIVNDDPEEIRIAKKVDFKETDKKIFDLTGKESYDLCVTDPTKPEDELFGVVNEDGKVVTFMARFGFVFTLELIEEAEAKALKDAAENDKDPVDAPPNHYTLRPGHVGKFVFISGAPGFGKSSTARRMMEKEGFVYYEGDCFMGHKNPYLPPGNNSAIDALLAAKHLKGVSKERKEAVKNAGKEWMKVVNGEDFNLDDLYSNMCEDILRERNRVGGDWVVAQAVPTRHLRDLIKSKLGPELLFVVLNLDEDHHRERLGPRTQQFSEEIVDVWMKIKFEPGEDDEENVFDLKITREMKLDDVVGEIMRKIS